MDGRMEAKAGLKIAYSNQKQQTMGDLNDKDLRLTVFLNSLCINFVLSFTLLPLGEGCGLGHGLRPGCFLKSSI